MRATLAIFLLAATGCSHAWLSDDIDLELDFGFHHSDELHTPYVQGARVVIFVNTSRSEDKTGWRLVSSRPDVLQVDGGDGGSFDCTAVGEGISQLRVYDRGGDLVDTGTVEVLAPDQAQLLAHGPLMIGRSDGEAAIGDELHVLEGGTATFLVKYFRGGQPLFGNGALAAPATGPLESEPRESFLFENREWLSVTPYDVASGDVQVSVAGRVLRTLHVVGVPESAIDRVEIEGMDESRAQRGEGMVALAEAYDAAGNPIAGVDFDWDVSGVAQPGEGDIYRYTYEEGGAQTLTASRAGVIAEATIHGGEGYVTSSNRIGCAAAPGRPERGGAAAILIVVGALLLGRRRSA